MTTQPTATASSVRSYLGIVLVLGLTTFAGPALAQLQGSGLETFRDDIWTLLIENVGLMVVGLAIIGALIGAMVADPGRGVGRAIAGGAIGAFLGGVPATAEYVIGLGA